MLSQKYIFHLRDGDGANHPSTSVISDRYMPESTDGSHLSSAIICPIEKPTTNTPNATCVKKIVALLSSVRLQQLFQYVFLRNDSSRVSSLVGKSCDSLSNIFDALYMVVIFIFFTHIFNRFCFSFSST